MPLSELILHSVIRAFEAAAPWAFSAALMLIAIGMLMEFPLEKEHAWFWQLTRTGSSL